MNGPIASEEGDEASNVVQIIWWLIIKGTVVRDFRSLIFFSWIDSYWTVIHTLPFFEFGFELAKIFEVSDQRCWVKKFKLSDVFYTFNSIEIYMFIVDVFFIGFLTQCFLICFSSDPALALSWQLSNTALGFYIFLSGFLLDRTMLMPHEHSQRQRLCCISAVGKGAKSASALLETK